MYISYNYILSYRLPCFYPLPGPTLNLPWQPRRQALGGLHHRRAPGVDRGLHGAAAIGAAPNRRDFSLEKNGEIHGKSWENDENMMENDG